MSPISQNNMNLTLSPTTLTNLTSQTSSTSANSTDSGNLLTIVFGILAAIMTTINLWQNHHYFRTIQPSRNGKDAYEG
ncbi:hypothetical protein V8E51_015739 [Hyaloscypha variabilis]